jgi:hypothetical protein
LVITVSATLAESSWLWPMPSRITLPPPNFTFLAVDRVVLLHLDPQIRVGEAHAVAGGRAEHLGIGLPRDFHLSAPITLPAKP